MAISQALGYLDLLLRSHSRKVIEYPDGLQRTGLGFRTSYVLPIPFDRYLSLPQPTGRCGQHL